MVMHPLALSEIPNIAAAFPEKRSLGPFPESLSSWMDRVVPKTAKTQERRASYCLLNVRK